MAVPFLFFPGLTASELVAFELVQTGLNIGIFAVLTILVTWALARKAWKQDEKAKQLRAGFTRTIVTVLVLSVLVGLVVLVILYFGIPFFIMYLRDYRKSSFPEWRVILHYVVVYLPALVASAAITSGIFVAAGVETYFIFSF
jgi:hypothetical protein